MTDHIEQFLTQCLVLDTETNSSDYKLAEVVESGFVRRINSEWVIFQELHSTVERPIPPTVEAICYITNEMVAGKPSFVNSSTVFQEVLNEYATGYLVAHNHTYDMRVLARHGVHVNEHNWICTWRLAKKLFMDDGVINATNLPFLRFALQLDVPIDMRCHRAGNDSFITGKLLEVMVQKMVGQGLLDTEQPIGPQVAEFAAAPIIYQTMPFGKHKGVDMKKVPKSYWQWAMNNTSWFDESADNFDPDLMQSIALALN